MVTRRAGGSRRRSSCYLLAAVAVLACRLWTVDAFVPAPAPPPHDRATRSYGRRQQQRQQHQPLHSVLRPFVPEEADGSGSDAIDSGDPSRLLDPQDTRAHGRHVCLDYTGFQVEARQGAEMTLNLIRDAVAQSGVREVHSRVVVLGDDGLSPPGFTGVCLVDESHVTAHCYSDRGWLAIDVFTCGAHPPEDIARGLHFALLAQVPGLTLVRGVTLDRFLHREIAADGWGDVDAAPATTTIETSTTANGAAGAAAAGARVDAKDAKAAVVVGK